MELDLHAQEELGHELADWPAQSQGHGLFHSLNVRRNLSIKFLLNLSSHCLHQQETFKEQSNTKINYVFVGTHAEVAWLPATKLQTHQINFFKLPTSYSFHSPTHLHIMIRTNFRVCSINNTVHSWRWGHRWKSNC